MSAGVDCLMVAEDPGAANFVAPVAPALEARGHRVAILADGLARPYLAARGLERLFVRAPEDAAGWVDAIRPRTIMVGTAENPDTRGLALVAEARRKSIPTIGVVDAAFNAFMRFRGRGGSPLAFAPDWILVPDEPTRQSFLALGMSAARVVVTGNPHVDHVVSIRTQFAGRNRAAERRKRFGDALEGRPVVVFATEGSARLTGAATHPQMLDGLRLRPGVSRSGRTEILLEAFVAATRQIQDVRPYLVLRLHPKDAADDYHAYACEFDVIDGGGDPLESIFCADVVVGPTTMLLEEAAAFGVRTISVVPAPEQAAWLPSVREGLTLPVSTRASLTEVLTRLLAEPSPPAAIHAAGAGATMRVLDVLTDLLSRTVHVRA